MGYPKAFPVFWLILLSILTPAVWGGVNSWSSLGPYGGDVRDLAIDPLNPGTLYATAGRIFKTVDKGAHWVSANSGLPSSSFHTIAINPRNPGTLYAGENTKLYKSTDGGANWGVVTPELPGYNPVNTVVVDPHDTATVYVTVGTSANSRILKSTDGASSWSVVGSGLPSNQPVNVIAVDPRTRGTLYAATWSTGIFKSTDGGARWNPSGFGPCCIGAHGLVVNPQNPDVLYAFGDGVWKSTDGGRRWQKTGLAEGRGSLALDPRDPNTLYGASEGAIYKTTNAGLTWTVSFAGPFFNIISALAVDPQNPSTVYAAIQGDGIIQSTDAGASWNAANSGLRAASIDLFWLGAKDPAVLYAGSNARLFKSTDRGRTWTPGARFTPGWVTDLVVDPSDSNTVYSGTFADPEYGIPGSIYRSIDGGADWETVAGISRTEALSVNALAIDARNPATVFAGTGGRSFGYGAMGSNGGILRSLDWGETWAEVNLGLPSKVSISALAVDPQDSRVVYAATGGRGLGGLAYADQPVPGAVFKSVDSGTSWSLASSGLPGDYVSYLTINPQRPGTLYAGTGLGIFKSSNSGAEWTNVGLPAAACTTSQYCSPGSLAIDPRKTDVLYAGTQSGIFKSGDGGTTWNAIDYPGLPGSPAALVKIDPQDSSTLYAASEGGLFTLTMVPIPLLVVDAAAYCAGASWTLRVSGALAHIPLSLRGTTNSQSWEIAGWATSDVSGSFSVTGVFPAGAEGHYTLQVEAGGAASNTISFAVSACAG